MGVKILVNTLIVSKVFLNDYFVDVVIIKSVFLLMLKCYSDISI